MGQLGALSLFQRLMETVVQGIQNVIVYIDDLLVHSAKHQAHIKLLDKLLAQLVTHNVKINLHKCFFGSQNIAHLGFWLTKKGVKLGNDKLKAISKATPPAQNLPIKIINSTKITEITEPFIAKSFQFLGLCNFFCTHVPNFEQLTAPLTMLTRKHWKWKGRALLPLALMAFKELQTYLCSKPVVAYPRQDWPYELITDASIGIDQQPGGLGPS